MYFRVESAGNVGPDNFIISSYSGYTYIDKFDINGTKYHELTDDNSTNAISAFLIKATSSTIIIT